MTMLLLVLLSAGLQTNNFIDGIRVSVRNEEHHAVLDRSTYAHLKPYTVTISDETTTAVDAVVVMWDVIDATGVRHSLRERFDKRDSALPVIRASGHSEFWPHGWIAKDLPGHPLMTVPKKEAVAGALDTARSITITVPCVRFSSGTLAGPLANECAIKGGIR